jgi:hypothetical protein
MKITIEHLKQMVREELANALHETKPKYTTGATPEKRLHPDPKPKPKPKPKGPSALDKLRKEIRRHKAKLKALKLETPVDKAAVKKSTTLLKSAQRRLKQLAQGR